MKPEEKIKTHLADAMQMVERAMLHMTRDDIEYAAEEIDSACERLMKAYAIAREYSDL